MLKNVSSILDDILLGQGILGFLSLACDRFRFAVFYQFYYQKKFKSYGKDIRWGRDFRRLVIPNSIRISCPEKITINSHARIDENVFLQCDSSSTVSEIVIGKRARINSHTHILSGSSIVIGEEVLIAPYCLVASNNHRFDSKEKSIMNQGMKPTEGILIGKGSWLGQNVKVLGGSVLGKNCVVGAGAVVTKGQYADYSKILNTTSVSQ